MNEVNPAKSPLIPGISLAIASIAGISIIAFANSFAPMELFVRGVCFLTIMTLVHLIGFRLYRKQATKEQEFDWLKPHLKVILFTQMICLVLAALMLDGGQAFRVCLLAAILHWLAIGAIAAWVKKPYRLLPSLMSRWGFFAGLSISAFVYPA